MDNQESNSKDQTNSHIGLIIVFSILGTLILLSALYAALSWSFISSVFPTSNDKEDPYRQIEIFLADANFAESAHLLNEDYKSSTLAPSYYTATYDASSFQSLKESLLHYADSKADTDCKTAEGVSCTFNSNLRASLIESEKEVTLYVVDPLGGE